jgi:hypothetical protein
LLGVIFVAKLKENLDFADTRMANGLKTDLSGRLKMRVVRWLGTLLVAVVVCAGVNAVIRPAQEHAHADERAQVAKMKARLDTERGRIREMEDEIRAISTELRAASLRPRLVQVPPAELRELRQEIKRLEQNYAIGMPPQVYSRYGRLIAKHNRIVKRENAAIRERNRREKVRTDHLRRLKKRYESLYPTYTAAVDSFNKKVEEHNALARLSSTTYRVAVRPRIRFK